MHPHTPLGLKPICTIYRSPKWSVSPVFKKGFHTFRHWRFVLTNDDATLNSCKMLNFWTYIRVEPGGDSYYYRAFGKIKYVRVV